MSYFPFFETSNVEEANSTQTAQTEYYRSSTLQIPYSTTQRPGYPAPFSRSQSPYVSPYAPLPPNQTRSFIASEASRASTELLSGGALRTARAPRSTVMSAYSSSSQDDTVYSTPGPRQYSFSTAATTGSSLRQVCDPVKSCSTSSNLSPPLLPWH